MKFYGNYTKNTITTGTASPARQDSITITGHWDKHTGKGLGVCGGYTYIYTSIVINITQKACLVFQSKEVQEN